MPIADAVRRYLVDRCGGADLVENPRHLSAEAADNISYGKPSRKNVMMHGCSPKKKTIREASGGLPGCRESEPARRHHGQRARPPYRLGGGGGKPLDKCVEATATDEQKRRLPRRTATLWGEKILPTCEAALNHRVIDVIKLSCGDFLGFLRAAGFDFYRVAVAVESDYFYREVFELAVGVERAVEYVHYVGHDFEV